VTCHIEAVAARLRTRQHRSSVQFPERGWQDGRVTISERVEAGRRERRVLIGL
jgi:hypothetical protein